MKEHHMSDQPIVVWGEIPVTDLQKSVAFYNTVFGYGAKIDRSGPNPMAMLGDGMSGTGAHLYPGKPAADGNGATLHLAVPDSLEATMQRCKTAGGTVLSDPIEIPPGRFAYALDPDGNSLGLFEPKGA